MKGPKSRNVLVVVGTYVPGKGLCQWLWGLWETHTATSPEGGEPLGGNSSATKCPWSPGKENLL